MSVGLSISGVKSTIFRSESNLLGLVRNHMESLCLMT